MLWLILLVLFLKWADHIPCGYKWVPMNDLERKGYDPDKLEDVIEYYEQKESGYFDL